MMRRFFVSLIGSCTETAGGRRILIGSGLITRSVCSIRGFSLGQMYRNNKRLEKSINCSCVCFMCGFSTFHPINTRLPSIHRSARPSAESSEVSWNFLKSRSYNSKISPDVLLYLPRRWLLICGHTWNKTLSERLLSWPQVFISASFFQIVTWLDPWGTSVFYFLLLAVGPDQRCSESIWRTDYRLCLFSHDNSGKQLVSTSHNPSHTSSAWSV